MLSLSTGFFRKFNKRNSLSTRNVLATSIISNESSVGGSSASICCFKIFRIWWKDGVSEVIVMSDRKRSEWTRVSGYHDNLVITCVRIKFTYNPLLVKVWSFPHKALRKEPGNKI